MSGIDGIYFRVYRDGKYQDISFCGLTEEEIAKVTDGNDGAFWKGVAMHLREVLNDLCEEFGIEVTE